MQLAELQQRYFRDEPTEVVTIKQGFVAKFTQIFSNGDARRRRKSFLSDHNSEHQEDQTKKTKDKPKSILNGIINDWVFLLILGVAMALFSFLMEWIIRRVGDVHIFTLVILDSVNPDEDGTLHYISEFALWLVFAVSMTMISSTIARVISKESIGSGVPEMKTTLRGAVVENYLNFRALIAVFFGLTFAMGAGMPIGKAGPYIHFSSIMAKLIGQQVFTFDANTEVTNSKLTEILAVGCAVGTSCIFGAPIGGVLFAIEVTSAHFSVQNYWRSFFSAVCSTIVLKLLRTAVGGDSEAGALFPTNFPEDAIFADEMFFFVMLGVICGFLAIIYVKLHRRMVLIRRNNGIVKKLFDLHWTLYPIFVSFVVSFLSYPEGFGNFMGGEQTFGRSVGDFFANCTWAARPNDTNYCPEELRAAWLDGGQLNPYLVLFCFAATYFVLTALAATLPIPNGASIPVGACIGRLFGELLARSFPDGVRNDHTNYIYPGVYSVVGAVALYGSVTDTISSAVIGVELTGQLVSGLPSLVAVLISTAIRGYFELSFFESLIQLKNLPTLPVIPPSTNCHGILVEQFMEKHVSKLTPKSTYSDVRKILDEEEQVKVVPVIESHKSKLLIGTCQRTTLQKVVNQLISNEKRHAEAERRVKILQKVFNYRYKSPQSQPALANGQTKLENHRDAKSAGNLDSDQAESRFTVLQVTQSRGWQLAKQAVADKRVHKLAMQLDLIEAQQDDQQESGKKKRLKKLARKIADVKGKILPDLYGENRTLWEEEQLKNVIDLHALEMDNAPFRLIAGTSLLNVYSLFSLLCLNSAFVTNHGRLVGLVSLAEIHQAVEDVQKGMLFPLPKRPEEAGDGDELNLMKNITNFRLSFRRRARQSIVQFMETDENPWINQKWSQNIASGLESKQD